MQQPWDSLGQQHLWLPYTQMHTAPLPLNAASTQGCTITLADGTTLIDGIASWWSACHGYNHPHIIQAMQAQLHTMPHIMLGGLIHEQASRLAARLCAITPGKMQRVFFSDSGSIAVEVALKMALQYWRNAGQPRKDRFIGFSNGYHGDTLGTMAIGEPGEMHKAFRNAVIPQYIVDIPADEYAFTELDNLLGEIAPQIAGMVIEPLVQGAGGMKFHTADVLAELHRLAQKHQILFIADEVATGFGRTGSYFACQEAGIAPDILCLGKALTAGMVPMAATLTNQSIFEGFLSEDKDKAFMHGPTFMGNPLAASAANASLDLFEQSDYQGRIEKLEQDLLEQLAPCANLPNVRDVRVKGAIGVVQLAEKPANTDRLRAEFIKQGCWIRPLGDVVYLTPAFTISQAELATLTGAIYAVLKQQAAL